MADPVIFHGTPLTPRAALQNIMPGRAGCVSFYRPEDLEALLAVCPQLMFRSRRLFILDGGNASRLGVGPREPGGVVATLLRLVGAHHLSPGPVRPHSGQPGRSVTDQRRPAERLAVRQFGRSGVPHGRAGLSTCEALREISSRCARMDRAPQTRTRWLPGLSPKDGRDRPTHGQQLAPAAHASWDSCRVGLPLHQRRRDYTRAERMAI